MTKTRRDAELRQLLLDHRAALEAEVQARLRAGRDAHQPEGRDDMEQADDDIRGDLSFALLQIKSEALAGIDAALVRLDSGSYGLCVACDQPIPSQRLRALPFAVRCQPCAGQRERAQAAPPTPSRWGPMSDVTGGVPV